MDNTLGVHVMARSKEFSHIVLGHVLAEDLVLLLSNLFEQLSTANILHDQVDILFIDVGFVILDDVGVVELGEDLHFLLDGVEVVLQLALVHNLDSNLMFCVVFVVGQEHLSKSTRTQHFGVAIDLVVLFQLLCTLLLG